MTSRRTVLSLVILLAICFIGIVTTARSASTSTVIVVNTTTDELTNDGNCSLREAIQAANTNSAVDACPAGSGKDTLIVPAGFYTLTTGSLIINSDLTISGTSAANTIVDGMSSIPPDRIFWIVKGTVTLSNLTIQNGRGREGDSGGGIYVNSSAIVTLNNDDIRNNFSYYGGGIGNWGGNLTLVNTTVSDNICSGLSGGGGGIFIEGGVVTLTHSNIISNSARNRSAGGGIWMGSGTAIIADSVILNNTSGGIQSYGSVSVTNSTIAGNTGGGISDYSDSVSIVNSTIAGNTGAGVVHSGSSGNTPITIMNSTISGNGGGGIFTLSPIAIVNSTISGNEYVGISALSPITLSSVTVLSNTDTGVRGSSLPAITVNFKNTLIAGNALSDGQASDCSGILTSDGYNFIQDSTGCTISGNMTGVITGTSPNLGALQNNGGRTQTHALLPGSPAIDAGNPAGCTDNSGNTMLGHGSTRLPENL